MTGQVRQGALDGVMLAAIAAASEVPEAAVRRAVMFAGHAGPVAAAALAGGSRGARRRSASGRPPRAADAGRPAPPTSTRPGTRRGDGEPVVVDGKLDGIRLQAHRDGDEVRLFTRSLDDITDRLPEVVEAVAALPAQRLVIDGEAIALDRDGRPRPFQETASRTMSSAGRRRAAGAGAVTPYFFDLLHVDGEDLARPAGHERFAPARRARAAGRGWCRALPPTPARGARVLRRARRRRPRGRRGQVPRAPYAAGPSRRRAG